MKTRDESIDILKGISIIGVVLIHALGLSLSSSVNFFIWNWMHFVVVGFVLSSGYVLNASRGLPESVSSALPWFRKRIARLLLPYYIYLVIHIALTALFPQIFSGYGIVLRPDYLLQSFLLTGGLGLSWIPALFIGMMIVFPILHFLYTKKRKHFNIVFLGLFLSTLMLVMVKIGGLNYRVPMMAPWSFVLGIGIVLYHTKDEIKNKMILFLSLLFGVLFFNLFLFLTISGEEVVLTHHKFPPDMVYLSYALCISLLVLFLARRYSGNGFFSQKLSYLGKNSYGLFFAHYLFLDFFSTNFSKTPIVSNALIEGFAAILCSVFVMEIYRVVRVRIVTGKS